MVFHLSHDCCFTCRFQCIFLHSSHLKLVERKEIAFGSFHLSLPSSQFVPSRLATVRRHLICFTYCFPPKCIIFFQLLLSQHQLHAYNWSWTYWKTHQTLYKHIACWCSFKWIHEYYFFFLGGKIIHMILGCIKIERDRILNILNGWMRSNIGKKSVLRTVITLTMFIMVFDNQFW